MSDLPTVQERAAEVILTKLPDYSKEYPFNRAWAEVIAAALAAAGLLADPTTSRTCPECSAWSHRERAINRCSRCDPTTSRTDEPVDFIKAEIGQEAYTYESPWGDWGEYVFETANPFETGQADDCEFVIRKRWRLAAVERLAATEGAT